MNNNCFPMVTIIIPCRNEEKYIEKCLDSLFTQDYPRERLEVLVVDGMSEDKTRDIVMYYSKSFPFIRILENPKKITPVAFNKGVRNAKGQIIMIMSAHAVYEKEYVSKCVKYLRKYGADNVGGLMITQPRNSAFIGKAITISLSHRFGVGNSIFRCGAKAPAWVDTVFGGCYRKDVFKRIGLFNEQLISNQDLEFNRRLKKRGGKILFVPEIISYYFPHSDFISFCKKNFRNGLWVTIAFKHSKIIPVSLRHLVPLSFIMSLIGTITLSIFLPILSWIFWFILSLYFLINIYFSMEIAKKENDFRFLLIMPIIFGSLHIVYGMGSFCGFLRILISKKFWKNQLHSFGVYLSSRI